MLRNQFSIRDAILFGWNKSLEHLFLIVKIVLTITVVAIVLLIGLLPIGVFLYVTGESYFSLIPITLGIAYVVASVLFIYGIMRLGLLRIVLDIYEHDSSDVTRLFSSFNLVFTYIGAAFLFNLMFVPFPLLLGFIGMVVPQSIFAVLALASFFVIVYLKVRFGFYMYPIVDKKFGSIESLKRSWAITDGSVIRIIMFEFLLSLIPLTLGAIVVANIIAIIGAISNCWYLAALAPALLLLIALFFLALVIPLLMLANVYVYKQLSENNHKYTDDHSASSVHHQ